MKIQDFIDSEKKLVSALLLERYGKFIPLQLADSELQLGIDPGDLSLCPTIYWNERGAHFILCKVGERRYRCQFFYSEADQYGTGRGEYDELETCVITLLQVQSDHERQLANISLGATAASIGDGNYAGPLVI
ncbi:MAG: hypothetical protein Q8O64_05515 [Sideroxyarcus sp.]|nr:hypothetical protein [Sideroxyarcus sp.]